MEQDTIIIGLDVHKETITAAVLPPGAERVVETLKIPTAGSGWGHSSKIPESSRRRIQPLISYPICLSYYLQFVCLPS